MRKLILLALGGAAAAYVVKSRSGEPAAAGPNAGGYVPVPEPAGPAPVADEAATADTVESDAVAPEVDPDEDS